MGLFEAGIDKDRQNRHYRLYRQYGRDGKGREGEIGIWGIRCWEDDKGTMRGAGGHKTRPCLAAKGAPRPYGVKAA